MNGEILSHYQLVEKLGDGATSVVYKAEDLSLGRAVVLKLVPPEHSADYALMTRFQHEARTASSLNHPNICTIYEIGEHKGRHFIAMEQIDGQVLSNVIAGHPLDTYRAIELGIQIADALAATHAEGIVHRDIKPANIFVTDRDLVKVLDFGLAVLVPSRFVGPKATAARWPATHGGTVPYMSPEQARGEDLDPRSDLFSTGIVLYEMITGRRPFAGRDPQAVMEAIVSASPVPPHELNAAVPMELERIVGNALEKNRKLRYQTASDLRADLQRLKRDLDSTTSVMTRSHAEPGSSPRPFAALAAMAPRAVRLRPRAAAVAASVVAGGALAAVAILSVPSPRRWPSPSSAPVAAAAVAPAPSAPAGGPEVTSPRNTKAAARAPSPPRARPGPPPVQTAAADNVASASLQAVRADEELRVARAKLDARLFDQALVTLKGVVAGPEARETATEAYFLIASIYEQQGKAEDAMATYLEIAHRFRDHPRAPEALFQMARNTLVSHRPEKEAEARRLFGEVAATYPQSAWAPRALMARGELEERAKSYQRDDVLATSVPSALVTYRQVATQYAGTAATEEALWKLGQAYDGIKRYDLAAQTFADVAARYPATEFDAWFAAADLFDKRLKDESSAQAAYARVPPSSPHFKDAQKRLRR